MRHRVKGRKFGREKAHRKLMLRNLVISLIEHERINTTQAKAKEMRSLVERMITYGKKGSNHHRKLAYKVLQDRSIVKRLFDDISPRFKEIEGGYTRVLKNGYRKGDRAPMAIIEFTQKEKTEKETEKENKK